MNQMTKYDCSICSIHESKRISVSLCGWANQKPHWKTYPCHQCPCQLALLLHSSPLSSKFLSKLYSKGKILQREESKYESPCVPIHEMSEYLPWTKGMEMIEKGRKEKAHDLLEMWSENYGFCNTASPSHEQHKQLRHFIILLTH